MNPAWLEGQLARVVWASPDGGYAVLRVRTESGEVTVVGPLASLAELDEGAFVAFEGRYEDHTTHGPQFRAIGWVPSLPRTVAGIKLYLEGVPGIGDKLAGRIVDAFGAETLTVLSKTPWRLAEVKGVKSKAKAIAEFWAADERGRALMITLHGLGIPTRTIEKIRRKYGDRAADVVARDPYRLAEEISGIGFKTADALARNQGLPADDPGRVRAAVVHVAEQAGQDGHCYLPRMELARRVRELDVPVEFVDVAIDEAAARGRVVVESTAPEADLLAIPEPRPDDRVFLAASWNEEQLVAGAIAMRLGVPAADVDGEVARAEHLEGVELDPRQRDAVALALRGGLAVITGGPGTGKTTLVRVLLRAARERGATWKLASPTGRAAKRLEEATGQPASTLHRLLEFNPGNGGFQRTGAEPLQADGLVVDEVSMVDLPLMAALLDALPMPPFPLVLVGDADQLPSVGPGQVLRDLIDSGIVPVVRLERVYRQGKDSGIVEAAARIHAGEMPISGEKSGYADFFLVDRDDADRAVETVVQVVAERLPARGFDPRDDVQVLAPTRKGPLGTEALNRALQARLNPDGAPVKRGDREFRVGDRVMCSKNRYDVEVWNGDVGRVVGASSSGLEVKFDDRVTAWGWDELAMLELAYAVTVHKSQGSEYPAVILALHPSHGIMLRRNLFYTAVTRARRFLCVIGTPRGWARAVGSAGGDDRWTRLADRLREVPTA
jgi:exodeoxyribonuclease V alpha subunit